jgi:hypothetical protein
MICTAYLLTVLLHLSFASVGWFERYQAYLLIGGVFVVLLVAQHALASHYARAVNWALLAALLILPAEKFRLTTYAPLACHNIYKQQYQMGEFLREYYPQRTAMVNDLGLVAFLHGGPLVDVWGLGSHEVLRARKDGRFFHPSYVQRLAGNHHVDVIAIYDIALRGVKPKSWVKVASWDLEATWWGDRRRRPFLGIPPAWPAVVFYAPSALAAEELGRNLRAFEPRLPAGMAVEYF